MMGKIIGVALVGLTQFILWIILTLLISTFAELFIISPQELTEATNTTNHSVLLSELNRLTGGITSKGK